MPNDSSPPRGRRDARDQGGQRVMSTDGVGDEHHLSTQALDLMSGQQKGPTTDKAMVAALVPELKLVHPGDTVRETVNLDGKERDFYLHVPKGYDASKPTPLMLVFNGYGDQPAQGGAPAGGAGMEKVTGLSQKSDEENFLVAYMNGNPEDKFSWNNGESWFSKHDDLKFAKGVMKAVAEGFNIDANRQYLSGFSQGGSFAHRVASAMPGKFAAIATVSTWMTGLEKPHSDNISVLNIHSKDDPTVSFAGTTWMPFAPEMQSQKHIGNFYKNLNNIQTPPETSSFTGANGKPVEVERAVNPETRAEVKQVFLHDEGHLWFGGSGDANSAINATNMVVDFLLSHSKKTGTKIVSQPEADKSDMDR